MKSLFWADQLMAPAWNLKERVGWASSVCGQKVSWEATGLVGFSNFPKPGKACTESKFYMISPPTQSAAWWELSHQPAHIWQKEASTGPSLGDFRASPQRRGHGQHLHLHPQLARTLLSLLPASPASGHRSERRAEERSSHFRLP